MTSRTAYKTAAIAAAVIVMGAAGLMTVSVMLERALASREVSRVEIPETELTIVLTEDFKHLHSYQVFERGHPISELRLLGPRYARRLDPARVTVTSDIASIEWGEREPRHFVRIDLKGLTVDRDSNRAGTPPELRRKR